jgi:hypothetical protein
MNPLLVPDWAKEEQEKLCFEDLQRERAKVERELLQKSIQADGPEYRKAFAAALALKATACELLGVTGTVEPITEEVGETKGMAGIRLTLTKRGLPNRRRSANVFFREYESVIRCYSESENEECFDFGRDDNGCLFVAAGSGPLSAD